MSKTKSFFRISVFAGLIFALVLAGCSTGNSTSTASNLGVVSSVTITDKIETSGNLGAGQLVQLTWGTSGLVDTVNVKVGQKVKAGDVLAALKTDSVPSSIITAQSDLATAQRDLLDLQNSSLSQAEAQQNLLDAKKAVETAQNNMDALAYPRASDVLIKNTQAQIWSAQAALTFAYKQYKELQHHEDGDPAKTAAQLAFTNAQLKLNTLTTTYNWYIAKPSQADYDSAKAALDIARANWDTAKRKKDNVKTGVDPLTIAAQQAKVVAIQSTVNAMLAIAPFDGEIIAVQAASGSAVNKDDNAIALVDRNTLKVETQIDETVVSSVSIGSSADVTIDSLPGTVLKGKVTQINPIGTVVSGLVKYGVTVALEPTDKPLLFGATTSVIIYTSTPHSMLAVPVGAVGSDTRGEYVMVVDASGNSQRVVVVSGDLVGALVTVTTTGKLAEGDQVELGATSSSSSNSNSGGGGGIIPGAGGPPGG